MTALFLARLRRLLWLRSLMTDACPDWRIVNRAIDSTLVDLERIGAWREAAAVMRESVRTEGREG